MKIRENLIYEATGDLIEEVDQRKHNLDEATDDLIEKKDPTALYGNFRRRRDYLKSEIKTKETIPNTCFLLNEYIPNMKMFSSSQINFPMSCRRLYRSCRRLLVGLVETNT